MNPKQARELAAKLIAFADRAERLGCENDMAVLLHANEQTFVITGGTEDDRNPYFYLETSNVQL